MSHPDFELLLVRLFSVLRLSRDRTASAHPGYTMRINGTLNIDLIGLQQGFINLRAVAGTLSDGGETDPLLRMLHANQFAFEHPPVVIGVDPDTSAVTVWSRQALSELGDDISCLWFERFVAIASAVHEWLNATQGSGRPGR